MQSSLMLTLKQSSKQAVMRVNDPYFAAVQLKRAGIVHSRACPTSTQQARVDAYKRRRMQAPSALHAPLRPRQDASKAPRHLSPPPTYAEYLDRIQTQYRFEPMREDGEVPASPPALAATAPLSSLVLLSSTFDSMQPVQSCRGFRHAPTLCVAPTAIASISEPRSSHGTSATTSTERFDHSTAIPLPFRAKSNVKSRWSRMVTRVGRRVGRVLTAFHR